MGGGGDVRSGSGLVSGERERPSERRASHASCVSSFRSVGRAPAAASQLRGWRWVGVGSANNAYDQFENGLTLRRVALSGDEARVQRRSVELKWFRALVDLSSRAS